MMGKKSIFLILLGLCSFLVLKAYCYPTPAKRYIQEIENLRKSGKQEEALKLIQKAPLDMEKPVTVWLESHSEDLEPLYLLLLADKQAKTNPGEAAKWFYISSIRAKYDALRCTDPTALSGIEPLMWSLLAPNAAVSVSRMSTGSRINTVQAALDWDQAHPARYSPAWICPHGIQSFMPSKQPALISEDKWPEIQKAHRESLVTALEASRNIEETVDKLKNKKILIPRGMLDRVTEGKLFPLSSDKLLFFNTRTFQTYHIRMGRTFPSGRVSIPVGGNSAIQLQNHLILLAGGARAPLTREPVYLMDPTAGTARKVGELAHLRDAHSATLLKDGTVLFAGGRTESFRFEGRQRIVLDPGTDRAEVYDPVSNQSKLVGALNFPKAGHNAIPLKDGRVLMVGLQPAVIEVYDPKVQTFQVIGKLNHSSIKYPLVTELTDGKVLVLWDDNTEFAELFDPATGQSENLPSPNAHWSGDYSSSILLSDGRVVLWGPEHYGEGTSSLGLFDPKTKQFTLIAKIPPQRLHTSLSRMQDDKVLLFGGAKEVLMFDPLAWDQSQAEH